MESNEEAVSSQAVTRQIKVNKKATSFFKLADIYIKHLQDSEQFSRVS